MDSLWNKYWVNTLSSSSLLTNADYTTGQIFDLSEKLEQSEAALGEQKIIFGENDKNPVINRWLRITRFCVIRVLRVTYFKPAQSQMATLSMSKQTKFEVIISVVKVKTIEEFDTRSLMSTSFVDIYEVWCSVVKIRGGMPIFDVTKNIPL